MSFFEDYVEDGLCCATCGTFIGFDGPGFVQYCCDACEPHREVQPAPAKKPARYPPEVKAAKPYSCQIDGCGKRFTTRKGKENHRKMAHSMTRRDDPSQSKGYWG